MASLLLKLAQVTYYVIMGEFVIALICEMAITTTIRLIQRRVLRDPTPIRTFSYWLVKYFLDLALKVNGIRVEVSRPVS